MAKALRAHSPVAFVKVPKLLISSELSDAEVRLFSYLSGSQQEDGFMPYSQAYLCDVLGWSADKVLRISKKLEARGMIRIHGTGRETRRYEVLYSPCYGLDDGCVVLARARLPAGGKANRKNARDQKRHDWCKQDRSTLVTDLRGSVASESGHSNQDPLTSISSILAQGEKGDVDIRSRVDLASNAPNAKLITEQQRNALRGFKLAYGLDAIRERAMTVTDKEVVDNLTRVEAADLIAALRAVPPRSRSGEPAQDCMPEDAEAECFDCGGWTTGRRRDGTPYCGCPDDAELDGSW